MTNIYVEGKGPQGPQVKESLIPAAVDGYERGLAVTYTAGDETGITLAAIAGAAIIGILAEDAVSVDNPCAVILFGQAVAQIGASVTAQQPLAVNASGLFVPATPGQMVVALALENQTYVSPGSLACVLALGGAGWPAAGSKVTYGAAAGAIPVATGTFAINGAGALAMTLATPTAAQDGTSLKITAATAHAHTVTTAADIINGVDDTITFAAVGDTAELLAVNQKWIVVSLKGATLSEV